MPVYHAAGSNSRHPMPPMPQPPVRKTLSPARSKPGLKHVVRSTLRSAVHSRSNRRRAQELVWEWVGAKWPRLLPSPSEMERGHFEYAVPGQELAVSTSGDGSVWTLAVAYNERRGTRTWMTRAVVADTGDADVMGLQTSCTDVPDAPLVVAPPRLLGAWVERLELSDGVLAVLGEPREVNDAAQLAAFCNHVLSTKRSLPVIALANKPNSRFYGVDPRGLAEAVRGLAHVACLTPQAAASVADRLGPDFGVVAGAARIYEPGFSTTAAAYEHPLVRDIRAADAKSDDAGAFRRLLCQKICALSVDAATDFEALLKPA